MKPTTYRIETVSDFLQVPADRRVKCLTEFLTFLALVDSASEVSKLLKSAGVEGLQVPAFVWNDDDKAEANLRFVLKDGDGKEHAFYQQTYKLSARGQT